MWGEATALTNPLPPFRVQGASVNIRNRLINFRVTDDELRRLKTVSALRNARCLSDFARSAILDTARDFEGIPDSPGPVTGRVEAFDRRLASLEATMTRLLDAFARLSPPRPVNDSPRELTHASDTLPDR